MDDRSRIVSKLVVRKAAIIERNEYFNATVLISKKIRKDSMRCGSIFEL